MMKNYFFKTAAIFALFCGMAAVSCSSDDGKTGNGPDPDPTPDPTPIAVTSAYCYYYGDAQKNGQDNFYLAITTGPVDSEGYPTAAGETYLFDLYSVASGAATPVPANGVYIYDANDTYAAGTIASEQSGMIPTVMENGEPIDGAPISFSSGKLTITKSGTSFKAEGSMTMANGTKIAIKVPSFTWVDDRDEDGGDPDGLLKENINLGVLPQAAAIYYGDAFELGNTNYAILLANKDVTKMISVEVMGPATTGIADAALPEGTFEIALDGSTGSALPGMIDGNNNIFGTFYMDGTNQASPIFGFAASGSVTISKSGSNYTVSVNVLTEDGFEIKGSYTGPLTLQEPEKDVQTTLTEDLALNLSGVTNAQAFFNGKPANLNTGVWFILLEQDAPDTDMLCMQIFTQSTTYSSDFPVGTYTCAETGAANTFVGGLLEEGENNSVQLMGSYYYKVNSQNQLVEFAPAAGGTFKAEADGSKYKFTIDIEDDGGNQITGTYTVAGTTTDDSKAAAPAKTRQIGKAINKSLSKVFSMKASAKSAPSAALNAKISDFSKADRTSIQKFSTRSAKANGQVRLSK